MKEILEFFLENPLCLTVPISIVAAFFGFKSWRLNRTRLGIDTAKYFFDFTQAFELLKLIYKKTDTLIIKEFKDISLQNLQSDKIVFQEILDLINKIEDKLKAAYFKIPSIYVAKNRIEDVLIEIDQIREINLQSRNLISSQIGFVYLSLFLIAPNIIPKQYKPVDIQKELMHKYFVNYYVNLVFEKK